MYQSFSDYSYVIYIADKDGEPLPIQTITSYKTSKLKKIFDDEQELERERLEAAGVEIEGFRFMTAEQRRSAGEKTLEWLYRKSKDKGWEQLKAAAPLRVYYVHLRVGEDGFEKEPELIAEMEVPEE